MKKLSTLVTAAVLFSVYGFAQQVDYPNSVTTYYMKQNVAWMRSPGVQMNIIGNPAKDVIVLQLRDPATKQYELSLYNSSGVKVSSTLYEHTGGVSTKKIDIAQLKPGMYFLVAWNKDIGQKPRTMRVAVQ